MKNFLVMVMCLFWGIGSAWADDKQEDIYCVGVANGVVGVLLENNALTQEQLSGAFSVQNTYLAIILNNEEMTAAEEKAFDEGRDGFMRLMALGQQEEAKKLNDDCGKRLDKYAGELQKRLKGRVVSGETKDGKVVVK